MSDDLVAPLGTLAEIRVSNVDKKASPGQKPVRLCNYMDVYSRQYITEDLDFMEATATLSEVQRFGVERGDVIITKDSERPDDIGIPSAVVDDVPNLVCGYHLALLRPPRQVVDSIYLAKQLGTARCTRYFWRMANGSTRYGLSISSIAGTPIRLIPLAEQRQVAGVLTTLDDLIEQTRALIDKTRQTKAGLMQDLFTRGVTPDGQLRPLRQEAPQLYKDSPLGMIPKEWAIESLRRCLLEGPSNGIYKPASLIGRGTLLVGQAAFTLERSIDFSLCRRAIVTKGDLSRYGLTENNILVSRVFATVEGVGLPSLVPALPEPAVFESNMMRLRVDPLAVRPRLLFEFLRDDRIRRAIRRRVNASNQCSVNQRTLNGLPVVVPPQSEQELLLEVIAAIDERQSAERQILSKLLQIRIGLMEDLLSGRVSAFSNGAVRAIEVAASV